LSLLGHSVEVVVDRPLGSRHPEHGFEYPVNYGELPAVRAADGEGLDAYVLGVDSPVARFRGVVVAVIERLEEDDPKLVVVPAGAAAPSDTEIEAAVEFQERSFTCRLHRA
jgi:inorganic pyrophosphatase